MPNVDAAELTSYVRRMFESLGAPAADADNVASHLVDANLKGHDSHGVIRASQYVARTQEGRYAPGTTPVIEQDTATTTVVDGNGNYGQVVGRFTMDAAILFGPPVACVTVPPNASVDVASARRTRSWPNRSRCTRLNTPRRTVGPCQTGTTRVERIAISSKP